MRERFYHVTARGNERRPIFRDARDRERFLERVAAVVRRHRVVVHAYVLMRNHYHLLAETPEANLSAALGQLNGVYTQDFNRRHRRSGHLFQGRYKSVLVDKDSYLVELSRYIHLNPVRVGEVAEAGQFPWSSAGAYTGQRAGPAWLTVEEVLRHFGRRRGAAQRAYQAFVGEGVGARVAAPWGQVVGQVLLGSAAWVARMRRRLRQRHLGPEITHAAQLRPRPPLSVVLTQVSRAGKMPREVLLRPRGGRGAWPRPVAMYLAWEVCGMTQREIGDAFGVSYFAVSKALRRAEQLGRAGGPLARTVSRLITDIQD